jgi:hypothetical protein
MSPERRRKALCDNASERRNQILLILNVRPADSTRHRHIVACHRSDVLRVACCSCFPAHVGHISHTALGGGFSMNDHDEFLDSVG